MPQDGFATAWAARLQAIEPPWQVGGIFPSEMLAFLIACDGERVDCIVESGRERGYSTQVLAEYAAATGVRVVSLDLPQTPEIARATRERLTGKPVQLIEGNALDVLGDIVPRDARRIALLVDGPKEEAARRVLLAAAHCFPVVLVAVHGYYPDTPVGRALRAPFPDFRLTSRPDELTAFAAWEREVVMAVYDGPRDVAHSTLGIARVPSRIGVRDLLLHDGVRGIVGQLKYLVRRLQRRAVTLPPPLVLARRWKSGRVRSA